MNYGIDLEKELKDQSPEDWIVGSVDLRCVALVPKDQIDRYLPVGEVQQGKEDTMDCATRAPNNILETKLNWLFKNKKLASNAVWLIDNGYVNDDGSIELSDAFTAILSGTTRSGNSLKAPLEAIRKYGFIPKSKLPLEDWMTWDDYHNPKRITKAMLALGEESKKRFPINYARANESEFESILDYDLIDTAGHAWPEVSNGEYPRTENMANHAWMMYKKPKFYAFDNYIDSFDGDFIKKLAENYKFVGMGYRVAISAINENPTRRSFWSWLCSLF
jgi:hypothetical protein